MLFAQDAVSASPEATAGATALVLVLVAVGLVVNFLPAVVALVRGHRSTFAIGLVCLFFGWTVVGWVLALVWAFADTGRHRR